MVATVLPAAPALAADAAQASQTVGIPVEELDSCLAASPTNQPSTGGWTGGRDVVSTGTSSFDTADVRPRSARLFEPCYRFTSEGEPLAFTIPMLFTDTPIPMLDENDDGEDDGAPSGDGEGLEGSTSCSTEDPGNCASVVEIIDYTEGLSSFHRWCIDRSGDTDRIGITYYDALGGPRLISISTDLSGTFGGQAWECPPGSDGSVLFDEGAPFGAVGSWIFDPSELASGLYEYCNEEGREIEDPICEGDEGGYPLPGSTGTGYYGGTQGAQFVFGAGDNFIADSHFQVTCSNTYSGASPVVHDLPMKESVGELDDNVDKSDSPPVGTGDPPQWWANKYWTPEPSFTEDDCAYLLRVDLYICSFAANDPAQFGCSQVIWLSDNYAEHDPYQGTDSDDPTVLICRVFPERPGCYAILNPDSLDVPIVCIIEAEGEFFAWVISWIGNLPGWIGCMVTPEGWDRSDLINRTIDSGPVGETRDAFVNAMPNGIACGEVATIPIPGESIVINSCAADFAPTWVKTTLGWLLVLGLCVLIVRRIMRSVGGDA